MKATSASQFWKIISGIAGVVLFLTILVAANIIIGNLRFRRDITEERLFTLSEGTRSILGKIHSPITIKFFFSASIPELNAPIKNFAQQVEDLLKEYQLAARGKIILEKYDPEPDSDAEEWAERYGLSGASMGPLGPRVYFGLVAVKGDNRAVIPVINPRQDELLEYNITRMITQVANPDKPVVGVLSSLPVMGIKTFPFAMPGQPRPRNQAAWFAFQNLKKDYEVRQISTAADKIDTNITALIIVHPKNLPDKTLYAIDQFVLRGGRLIVFLDPMCLTDAATQQPTQAGPAKTSSNLEKLLPAWGVEYDPNKVLADINASTRIMRLDNELDDSPVFLTLRQPNIDGKDVITAKLESMLMPCAGAFSITGSPLIKAATLLVSSEQSQLINRMIAQMDSATIRRNFKPGLKRYILAVRLHGQFKSAFPEGKPKEDVVEQTEPPPAVASVHLQESSQPNIIILVADVDLLFDQFAGQLLSYFGQNVFQPINDNINFFANAVDQLAGSIDLVNVRSRGRFERPFDLVQDLLNKAQDRWLERERELREKLESTEKRLQELQSQKDETQRYILSPEQEAEIKRYKQKKIQTDTELKQVRRNLREDIERLGVKVKAVNILLIPAIVCIGALAFGLYRRAKTKR